MSYFKCIKCEINYVKEAGGICSVCRKENTDSGTCMFCGVAIPEHTDICPICAESLSVCNPENVFDDESDA